jgi:hypothetical protein
LNVRNKQFCIKLIIPYVEIDNEHGTVQLLSVGGSSATKHARGNGIISDTVSLAVAQRSCGAAGNGHKTPTAFVVLQYLKRGYIETRHLLKQMVR